MRDDQPKKVGRFCFTHTKAIRASERCSIQKPNSLHVAIALENIQIDKLVNKKSGITTEGNTVSGVTQSAPPLNVKLSDLFANVNPKDDSFLKYVPKQFFESNNAVCSFGFLFGERFE